MKKIFVLLLLATMPFATWTTSAQMSIPARPQPIKQTFIVSTVEGRLYYTINNGKRVNYRVPQTQIPDSPLPPKIVYVFNPEWIAPPAVEIVEQPHRDSSDFAALVVKLNKERQILKWVLGVGQETVYEFANSRTGEVIKIGTKNGMLDYIIRKEKRENYRVEPIPKAQKIIYRPVYLWNQALFSDFGEDSSPDLETRIVVKETDALNENDFALLEQKLRKERWRLKAFTSNDKEIIYYYEK